MHYAKSRRFGVASGQFHLNNWKEIDKVELALPWMYAHLLRKNMGLKRFKNAPGLCIRSPRCCRYCCPTTTNYARWAISKSKHVFVENPHNTMPEARKLWNYKEANIKFQGHVERFNPAFLALKD